jgi:DNA topoisomerase-6 subunit A
MARKKTTKQVTSRLSRLADVIERNARKGADPSLDIPVRSVSNVSFDRKAGLIQMGDATQKRTLFSLSQARKFAQTLLVATGAKRLKDQAKTTSIRDLYYMMKHTIPGSRVNTFDDQEESDSVIEDMEVMTGCLREELNLHASNRGALVGDITISDGGDTINCRRMGTGGWSIPSIVEPDVIKFRKCDAKFILLVEKDAVWRRLNEDRYWEKNNCVLVHGHGQPPRGVRRLLHRMSGELGLQVYVFVDNDPWGYYIHSVVKQGSINLAFESQRMAVPQARFIGLSAFDKDAFGLPDNVTIKLDKNDLARARQVMSYEWFKGHRGWQREVRKLISNGFKMELEALSIKGLSFVADEYLPRQMRDKKWLD